MTKKVKYLSPALSKRGDKFRLLTHTYNEAIWEHRVGGIPVAYEVGYRKYRAPRSIFKGEEKYDLIEAFWRDEDFGSIAWTYPTLELAERALKGLQEDRNIKYVKTS